MRLNLRQVEAFRAVMVTGSITNAADMMFITQPAVSRLIADFELAVGFKLFDRSGRRLTPTSECHALFAEVQRSYAGLEHISRTAEAISNMQLGHLSVVSMPIASTSLLPDVIAEFTSAFPEISISLWTWPRDQALEWIVSQQYDLGILTLPITDPAVRVEAFQQSDAVCILPRDHPLTAKDVIEAKDLEGEVFISLTSGSRFRHHVDSLFEREGVNRITKIEARSAAAICSIVERGTGVSILGRLALYGRPQDRLAVRPFVPAVPFEAGIVFPSQTPVSAIARKFADITLETVKKLNDSF
jgi:DNA-binding transcriptional LysR family regulator